MKTTYCFIATILVVGLSWHGGVTSARQDNPALPGGPAISVPTGQDVQVSDSMQTIRIEPVDATHVRLRLEGRGTWIVDSAGFRLLPNNEGLRVIAAPGTSTISTGGPLHEAESFELSISASGVQSVRILGQRR